MHIIPTRSKSLRLNCGLDCAPLDVDGGRSIIILYHDRELVIDMKRLIVSISIQAEATFPIHYHPFLAIDLEYAGFRSVASYILASIHLQNYSVPCGHFDRAAWAAWLYHLP